jgi:hypothetical protein
LTPQDNSSIIAISTIRGSINCKGFHSDSIVLSRSRPPSGKSSGKGKSKRVAKIVKDNKEIKPVLNFSKHISKSKLLKGRRQSSRGTYLFIPDRKQMLRAEREREKRKNRRKEEEAAKEK